MQRNEQPGWEEKEKRKKREDNFFFFFFFFFFFLQRFSKNNKIAESSAKRQPRHPRVVLTHSFAVVFVNLSTPFLSCALLFIFFHSSFHFLVLFFLFPFLCPSQYFQIIK